MRFHAAVGSLSCALVLSAPLAAQSPAVVTVVKAERLLDPRSGKFLAPAGARTLDLGGATLSRSACVLLGAQLAREDLESGMPGLPA
jgi:hypothetical protein